jgi:hypothetical protein
MGPGGQDPVAIAAAFAAAVGVSGGAGAGPPGALPLHQREIHSHWRRQELSSYFEPMCFLTSSEMSATAISVIELICSIGIYMVMLGQVDELHGHSFAFVGETIGNQLPSTFLEPADGAQSAIARSTLAVPNPWRPSKDIVPKWAPRL